MISHHLLATIIGTTAAIAILQIPVVALDATQIYQIAQQITVLIDGQNPGTGVLIAREGNIYYVLTAKHVVETEDEYEIVTPDQKRYPLDYTTVKKLPDVDLAVISFNSDRDYRLAQLGESKNVTPGAGVHIYGFPNPGREIQQRIPQFTSGQVTASSQNLPDGYGLVYTNVTRAGMSGGPVLNDQGIVIGIHGRAESEAQAYQSADQSGTSSGGKIGFNLGIPIDTFTQLAPKAGIELAIQNETQPEVQTQTQPTPTVTTPTTTNSNQTIPSRPGVITPSSTPSSNPICAGRNCN